MGLARRLDLPGAVLILLGLGWLLSGRSLAAPYSGAHSLVPSLNLANLVFFSGVLLAFSGMEMAGFSADSARNPKKDIPRATLLACVVLVVLYVLGTLAIAFVVPANQIDLHAGLFQAFQVFFDKFGVGWLLRPMRSLVFIGGIALLSTWMYGPAKGFMRASSKVTSRRSSSATTTTGADGVLPDPGGIGTLFSLLFLFEPTIATSYWILSALTTQLLVIMYVLMFAALMRLRYTQPDTAAPVQDPRAASLACGSWPQLRHRGVLVRVLPRFRSAVADRHRKSHALRLHDGPVHRAAGDPSVPVRPLP